MTLSHSDKGWQLEDVNMADNHLVKALHKCLIQVFKILRRGWPFTTGVLTSQGITFSLKIAIKGISLCLMYADIRLL